MALRGKKPEKKEERLKMFVYGIAGVGKTVACLQFPNAYVIDTEKGTDDYSKSINKSNSVVFQSLNPDEIREEVKELLTTKHQYRTLIIDPITHIYNSTQEKWTRVFAKYAKDEKDKEVQDFGMRYWGKVKSDFKGLQRLILALDMNVIVTAHQKDVYGGNFSKIGVTFDSMKGDDYLFDLIFRVERRGKDLMAITVKERAEIGENKFPSEFIWSYQNFVKFYGKEIIEKEAIPLKMATEEQIKRVKNLVETLTIEDGTINKWFDKAQVDRWEDMTEEQVNKCVEFMDKKLDKILANNIQEAKAKGGKK